MVCYPAVRQFDFFCLFVKPVTCQSNGIHQIGPRLQQSTQFGVVLAYPQRLVDVRQGSHKDNGQRTTAVGPHFLGTADDNRLHHAIHGRNNAQSHDEQPQRPAEEP